MEQIIEHDQREKQFQHCRNNAQQTGMAGRRVTTHQYIAKPFLLDTLLTRLSPQDTHDITMQKFGVFLQFLEGLVGSFCLFA